MTMIIIVAMVTFLGYCRTPMAFGQESKVIHIQNFGKPMSPGLPPYRNDPEGIVKSENFYSLMPGSRELRSGYSDLIPYDTISDTTTSPIDAFTIFTPDGDSTAIVFAAGGYYYTFNSGYIEYIGRFGGTKITVPSSVSEIRPYTPGNLSSDTVRTNGYFKFTGTGISRFIRDLEIGDSLIIADSLRFKVSHIVDDSVLYVDTTAVLHADTLKARSYIARRGYTDTEGIAPYFHSAKGLLYTGNQLNESQVIYGLNTDGSRYMRTLGILDSFLIDTVYTLYPPRVAGPETNVPADTIRWDSVLTYKWQSWHHTSFTAGGHTSFYADEFMLVNRRKLGKWIPNEFVEDINENPDTYYLRIGAATSPNTGTFFQIKRNDDTAIALSAWYVDSTELSMGVGEEWNDSIFHGRGTTMVDTIDAADVDGKWAYIYSTVGLQEVIVPDSSTGVVTVAARGGLFYTVDSGFPIDSTEMMKGMHYIHLTGSDIDFPGGVVATRTANQRSKNLNVDETFVLQAGDTLISTIEFVWACVNDESEWYYARGDAAFNCGLVKPMIRYTWASRTVGGHTVSVKAVGNDFYPIRYMRQDNDTLFFITSIFDGLTSTHTDTTSSWEIVRVGMPNWSGMTGWGKQNQLMAWGDTLAPGLLSFSDPNDHWRWSALNDVLVGHSPNDPIIFVAGNYDGQAVIFKANEIIGYNGDVFTQISASDGLAAPGAVLQLEKEMFWLDVDGPKRIKRRDFSGYSIDKLGSGLDPLFGDWVAIIYGTDVVPYSINPAYRYKSLMAWNKRDNHIYLFFPEGSSTTNNRVAIFNMNTQQWDGVMTIPAATAGSYEINDTLRIVIGSPTDASISALSYVYNDDGVGIDGILTSAKFFLTDERGFPVKSKLGMIQLVYRGSQLIDTLWVDIDGDNATTRITPTEHISQIFLATFTSTLRPSTENVSMFWRWDLYIEGLTAGGLFIPYDLYIELLPIERND